MSDTESIEPVREGGDTGQAARCRSTREQIRGEIENAREATERFRAKAADLIEELRAREAKARDDGRPRARGREERPPRGRPRDRAGASGTEERSAKRASKAIQEAAKRAGEAEGRATAAEGVQAELEQRLADATTSDDEARRACRRRRESR